MESRKQGAEDAAGAVLVMLRDRSAKNGRQGLMYSIGDLLNDRDGLVLCSAQTQDELLAETVARAEAAAANRECAHPLRARAWTSCARQSCEHF